MKITPKSSKIVFDVNPPRVNTKEIDYSRLREGLCPFCNVALVRLDDCGECPDCGAGWSLVGDTISLHLVANTLAFDAAAGSPIAPKGPQ